MEFVRKYIKYIIGILVLLVILVISFIVSKTYANPTVEVVKYVESYYYSYNGFLYSNNELHVNLFDSSDDFKVIKNVVDVVSDARHLYYVDSEKNLYDVFNDKLIMNNVKKMIKNDLLYGDVFMFITEDDKLYALDYWGESTILENKESDNNLYYLFDNVKDCKFDDNKLILRDNNNSLYAMGDNFYGKKINEGNYLSNLTKIMDNVIQYNYKYAVDENGDLYMFDKELSRPTLVTNNVSKFDSLLVGGCLRLQ